jgi:S1-C subfamily serine protease/Tfp pilus assembly protein PilF
VAYVVTPEAGVVRADDVNVAVQVMVMPVDAESVVADMTAAQALEQVLPIVLQQEPGLERVGAVREVRLGDLPAAALRLRGSLKSKAGRFAGDVTVGFRDGLMAFVVTLAPEAEAEVHAKAFADVLRQSSFLARTPVARRDSPVAAQKAVADHRASVVSILSYRDDEPFSAGTGFVVRDDGYVLTNHHVIWDAERNQPATRFTVEWDADLGLGRVDAQLVGYRHTSTYQRELVPGLSSGVDIALLKLPEGARYVPVSLVSAREVQLADPVLTLGFPARDKIQTVSTIVTSGIVTRFNKDFTGALESIYIDAPIAHGSSGGPALNLMVDRVFGLNTFGSFGIRGVEDLWNYFGVIPIDYALREFPLATRVVAARDGRLDTAELYDIALHSAAAGAVQGSLAIAERALSSAPDSADTNYLVGRLTLEQAVAQENVDAGLARLGRALELDADHLPSLSFLAQAYVQLGDPKRAQVYADRAVAAHPTDADALQVRALVFLAAKSYERALADLSKAKQLTQKVVPAPYLLAGETYYAMQRHDEGRREFEQASDIHPSNLPARLGVARYYTLTSQPVAALLEYSKIDRAQPGHPTVLAAIGRSYLAVDAPDKALASFLEAIDRARKLATLPTPDVYLGGAAAAQSAKVDKAGTAIALYLGLLSTYWGQDSAFDGHLGIARLLERDAGLRAIARGHVAWALDLRADDADAVALARKLGDARLSLEAIRAMVERLGYPPTLAGLVIRETPLDFAVEPTQQNMDELQKFLPGEVAVAIFLSQEKHRQPARGAVARTDTTAPVPAALAGVWATRVAGDDAGAGAAELVLALEPAGRYQIQIRRGGEVATEQGRFESDAGRLQFFSDGGEQSDYRYELRGRQLVLSSDESGTFVLDRVR